MTVGGKSFPTLALAVVLFGLAGAAVAVMVPLQFDPAPSRPPFAVFLTVGVTTVLLTAGLFALVSRLGMGFGKTALSLAAGYNILIATVKLGLAPAAMYEANQEQPFDAGFTDPNSPLFYAGVGVAVLTLYLGVFCTMYVIFRRRFRRRSSEAQAAGTPHSAPTADASTTETMQSHTDTQDEPRMGGRVALVLVLAIMLAVILAGLGLWWVPVFFIGFPAMAYLSYVFTSFGAAIVVALALAAVLAWMTFDRVEQQAYRLGDATLLASFFWLGLALILLYHAMWVILLLTLVSIWPFTTYTPK